MRRPRLRKFPRRGERGGRNGTGRDGAEAESVSHRRRMMKRKSYDAMIY